MDPDATTSESGWITELQGGVRCVYHRDSRRVPIEVGDTVGVFSLAVTDALVVDADRRAVLVELRDGTRHAVSYDDISLQHIGPPTGVTPIGCDDEASPSKPGFWVNRSALTCRPRSPAATTDAV